jgi:hypothetical protein
MEPIRRGVGLGDYEVSMKFEDRVRAESNRPSLPIFHNCEALESTKIRSVGTSSRTLYLTFLALWVASCGFIASSPSTLRLSFAREADAAYREVVSLSGQCSVADNESITVTGDLEPVSASVPCTSNIFSFSGKLSGADGPKQLVVTLLRGERVVDTQEYTVQKKFCANDDLPSTDFSGGAGTVLDPYAICTAQNWQRLFSDSTYWSKHFILKDDLDLSDLDVNPIGSIAMSFTGSLNGNGKTISNVKILEGTTYYIGLFGRTNGATIENLNLSNVEVVGGMYVGGLVGFTHSTTIRSVRAEGLDVTGSISNVGGLVGSAQSSTLIQKTFVSGSVDNPTVNTCRRVGGITGNLSSSSILESVTEVNVSSLAAAIGGFAGWSQSSTIRNSYSTGAMSGGPMISSCAVLTNQSFVGGAVGVLSASTLEFSYATGSATTTGTYASSLVGLGFSGAQIRHNFGTGVPAAMSNLGGICTDSNGSTSVGNYWDVFRSTLMSSGLCAGTGINTSTPGIEDYFFQKENAPMSNWDFDTIWIERDNNYPTLRWLSN